MNAPTDINKLDKYVGLYVTITDRDGEGGSGYVTKIEDAIDYRDGSPSRCVHFDWGGGWPVDKDATIAVTKPLTSVAVEIPIDSPIQLSHRGIHAVDGTECEGPTCPDGRRARAALEAFREWQMKSDDRYWRVRFVKEAHAYSDDPVSIGELLRAARFEGAPPHILDQLNAIAERPQGSTP